MPKVLLTGATGFLGSHLLPLLLERGWKVHALLRKVGDLAESERLHTVLGDVCDPQSVFDAAKGCDGLFHCAGVVSRKPEMAGEMWRVNTLGTRDTLKAAREAGVKRCIVASTSGTVAISEAAKPIPTEESETPYGLIGKWPYYRSKLYAEEEAFHAQKDKEGRTMDVIGVLPSLLLGPGDLRGSSTDDIRLFLEEKIPAIPAGGLSFVDVRDAAKAMILAFERGRAGQRYLLGGANLTFADFFGKLSRLSEIPAPWLPLPKQRVLATAGQEIFRSLLKLVGQTPAVDDVSQEMAQYFWYLDDTKAREEIGFVSRDPMETLRDTILDLRERGVVWPRSPKSPS